MQVSNSKPASAFLKRRFMKEKNGTEICTLKNGEEDNMRISNIIKEGRKTMEKLKGKDYFSFGIGNVASQLSWTMVSSYLTLFYTDVFAAGTCCICISTDTGSYVQAGRLKKANERKRRQKRYIFFCPLFLYKKKESKYCMKLG